MPSKSGTITLLKLLHHLVQIGLAAASASASCDVNPRVAAVWRGHVFGAYQCSLSHFHSRQGEGWRFLSPEKWIYGINVVESVR